jgi:urease accessory protein
LRQGCSLVEELWKSAMEIVGTVAGVEREIAPGVIGKDRDRVAASLRLDFEFHPPTGQTILVTSYQEPPLKVVRAFAVEDGAALVHLHNVSGGLLGGDRLALAVNVGAHAQVQVTTTGAARIYRPRAEASAALQSNEIYVGERGLLEYLPDAVIPFAGARFSQRTSIRLADGAGLFWWEILAPGREARGEIFEYESVEFKTDLVAGGRLVAAERSRLEPQKRGLAAVGRLGAYRTWASFYVCRVGVEAAEWLETEKELRGILGLLGRRGDALWGVSTLPGHGLIVRCAAKRGRDVLPGLHAVWSAAKWRLYGRAAVVPRKVN